MHKLILLILLTVHAAPSLGMEGFPHNEKLWKKANDSYRKALQPKKPLTGKTRLWFDAVHSYNIDKVYALLNVTDLVNARDTSDATALHVVFKNFENKEAPIELLTLLLTHNADHNQLDRQGNTALHYAFQAHEIHFKKYTNKLDESRNIQRDLMNENYTTLNAHIEGVAALADAQQDAHMSAQRTKSYIASMILLIEHGASGRIANPRKELGRQTVEQMWPAELVTCQFLACRKATINDQDSVITHCLQDGMYPDIEEQNDTLLYYAILNDANKSIRTLLYHGAQLTTLFKLNEINAFNLNAVQLAGLTENAELLKTVLESPQGPAPLLIENIPDLKKIKKEIFTFLCCAARPEIHPAFVPGEIQDLICSYIFPSLTDVIHTVPLSKLKEFASSKLFKKSIYQPNALVEALTERHMCVLSDTLEQPCMAQPPYNRPIHEVVRLMDANEDDEAFVIREHTEFTQLLDPAFDPLEKRRDAIKAQYAALLN